MDSKMPPLPRPLGADTFGADYTADQVLAYGAECRRLALEQAAQEFDRRDNGDGWYWPDEPAEIIRALAAPLSTGGREG